MRKKSIAVFVSVYAALCIAYGAAGSGFARSDDADITDAIVQSTSQVSSGSGSSKNSAASKPEISSELSVQSSQESSTVFSAAESIQEGASEIEELPEEIYPGSGASEETVIAESEIQQYEESIEEDDEDEYSEEKPSLEEFLKGLRCSGCRHNCTLFSPRCMNGARKAGSAQSQYYQIYGE